MSLRVNPGHWRTKQRLMAILAAVLLTVTTLLVSDVPLASADPGVNRPFATYNMQGSGQGTMWTMEIGPLVRRTPVVALQEAGSGPPPLPQNMPGSQSTIPIGGVAPHPGMPQGVNRSPWRYRGVDYWVYFLQTHVNRNAQTGALTWGGGRVNLSVVTQQQADEVRVVENPVFDANHDTNYRARRALGIRIGTTIYYNIHARGNDVRPLLEAIRRDVPPGHDYYVTGDWNLNIRNRTDDEARNSLHLQANEHLVRPNRATHQNGSEIDYAVRGSTTPDMTATVPAGGGSDHFPVEFAERRNPSDRPPVLTQGHTYSVGLTNVSTGASLDVPEDSIGRVITHPPRFNENQRFALDTTLGRLYMFKFGAKGEWGQSASLADRDEKCPGITKGAENLVLMQSCMNPNAQWTPENPAAQKDPEGDRSPDEGPLRWRNVSRPDLCLTGTKPNELAIAAPCQDTPLQLWWMSSRHVHPRDWEIIYKSIRIRAENKLYLDAQGGSGADRTHLITHARKNVDNQLWMIEYQSPEDNLVRIKGSASLKCVDVLESDTAGPGASSIIYRCDDTSTKNDNAGHRWLMETVGQAERVHFINEATHLCLMAPKDGKGDVTVDRCSNDPRQIWTIEH